MRVEIPDAQETGARGAALVAGVGAGIFADIDTAMERAVRIDRSYEPDPDRGTIYSERFRLYRQLVEAMVPTWTAMASDREAGPA